MSTKTHTCVSAGISNQDVAGTGVLAAFSAQALISIFQAFYYMKISRGGSVVLWDIDDVDHGLGLRPLKGSMKLLLMNDIMLSLSDGQTILGVALLLASSVQINSLGLYHLHLVYDTASSTAMSFWVTFSAACGYKKNLFGQLTPITKPSRRRARLLAVLLYIIMHLIFTAQFLQKLDSWNDSIAGYCYNSSLITMTGALPHPIADKLYVVCTTFILVLCLLAMTIYLLIMDIEESRGQINPRLVVPLGDRNMKLLTLMGLCTALTLFPLHLYMMLALRFTNQDLLIDPNENQWGFGQSAAVIMLGITMRDCVCAWLEYREWRRE